jgi:3-dehydroquinate dehydratase/shikimate dehydrogenase
VSKVCLCLTGKTIARDLEVLNKYRRWIDVVELRVDYLEPDERFHIGGSLNWRASRRS